MSTPIPRVVDFSTHFSGPLAAHLLSEIGADVIKVEPAVGGDGNREMPPLAAGQSVFHAMLNAGKRSVAVERRTGEWPGLVQAAAAWADVVIVGGSATSLESIGLDFASLVTHNQRLVYCAIPAYGNRGVLRDWPAHGQCPDAFAGAVAVADGPNGPTTSPEWRGQGTTLAGVFAALGIMTALYRRSEVPGPQYVETSLWSASLWSSWRDLVCVANVGHHWSGTSGLGSRYRMYRTADDRALLVAPIERKFWERFCDVIGLPARLRSRGDWTTARSDFGSGPGYEDEQPEIQQRIGKRSLHEWMETFGPDRIPVAPVLSLEEVIASEHAREELALRQVPVEGRPGSWLSAPRIPIRLGDSPDRVELSDLGPAPGLGQHDAAVREMWGINH